MDITLDEFYELWIKSRDFTLGSFQEMASQDDDKSSEPLIKYVPTLRRWIRFFVFS